MRDVEKTHFSEALFGTEEKRNDETINGVAALCSTVMNNNPLLENGIVDWLSKGHGGSIQTVGLRRALIATFSSRKGEIQRSLYNRTSR